jgi:hypothetical protein
MKHNILKKAQFIIITISFVSAVVLVPYYFYVGGTSGFSTTNAAILTSFVSFFGWLSSIIFYLEEMKRRKSNHDGLRWLETQKELAGLIFLILTFGLIFAGSSLFILRQLFIE